MELWSIFPDPAAYKITTHSQTNDSVICVQNVMTVYLQFGEHKQNI